MTANGGPNLAGLLMMRRDAEFERLRFERGRYGVEDAARRRDIAFQGKVQPYELRSYELENLLKALAVPEARANARFYDRGGAFIPALNTLTGTARSAAEIYSRFRLPARRR